MSKANDKSYALCFNCASIYPLTQKAKSICTACGFEVDKALYDKVVQYAKTSVYYGYNYRKFYEKQIEADRKITKGAWAFDPATVACFLGVAALSGIIGNISYDIVNKAFKKIINNSKELNKDIGQKKISITNDAEINIFIQYIKEFHLGEYSAPDEVKFQIIKEEIICNLTDSLYPVLSEEKPTREKIHEAVEEAFNRNKKADKPSSEDFGSFWKKIE